MTDPKPPKTPIHQWTNDDGKVLIVRFVGKDGVSYTGENRNGDEVKFKWPRSGLVEAPDWNPDDQCGGGLHGWPWGLSLGDGKDPDYSADWLVFAADPSEVVDLGGKVKAKRGEVVCFGPWHECLAMTALGLAAWCAASATGEAHNTGYRSASSNTGDRSASSNTGNWSASSNTGNWSASSNTGYRSASSNTGYRSASSNTGNCSASSNTGDRSASSNTGNWSGAQLIGEQGTIELGPLCVGHAMATRVKWVVHPGAVLLVAWDNNGKLRHRCFDSSQLDASDGDVLVIQEGEIVSEWRFD